MSTIKAEASLLSVQADRLIQSCANTVALRVPATVRADIREELIAEGALGLAIGQVIDAAERTGPGVARPLHSMIAVMVERGRDNGMPFADLFEAMNSAFQDACVARSDQEADAVKREEGAKQ